MTRERTKATIKTRPMSVTQRKQLATQQLLNTIGGTDQAAATLAALEVITEWLSLDAAVRQRLREKYAEIELLTNGRRKPVVEPMPAPLPGRGRSLDSFDPYGKLNPYHLLEDYGPNQLRAVLGRATQPLLREAVDVVQERKPETKPASRTVNADMIDYIVEHVAGPGY